MIFSIFLLFFLFKTSFAGCLNKYIHNASEFIKFSNEVNSGTTYYGYTVYLVNDIDFSGLSSKFEPIGKGTSYLFQGTFDGQGYAINNLKMSTSLAYVGVLGGSYGGLTVKNLVLSNSCSYTCSFQGSGPMVAGIVSWCRIDNGPCIIENSVNMASITYNGKSTYYTWLGGIVGWVRATNNNYEITLMNCVNYGSLYNSGTCSSSYYGLIGGIIGEIYKLISTNKNNVKNCLNYGTITNTITKLYYYTGGIVGMSFGSTIENCMSVGAISTSSKGYTSGIIGRLNNYQTTLKHCYWTSSTNYNTYIGSSSKLLSASDVSQITINSDNANVLNNYGTNGWNKWTYNQNNVKLTFVVHNGKGFSYLSQMILLPKAERRGYSFLFWCVNQNSTNCSNKYSRASTTYTSATTLYAQWVANSCTVSLDVNGGDSLPTGKSVISTKYDKILTGLSTPTKKGYTFIGWYTIYGERLTSTSLVNNACNCSLTAYWSPSNYTVILDVNRGNELANNKLTVTFGSTYGTIPSPTRDGFSFSGWFTNDNKQVTSSTVVKITSTQTLYAHWGPKTYTVTLDVNGGNAIPSNKRSVSVPADKAYNYLLTPTRRGYSFAGWYTVDGGLITNNTETTAIITKDQTVHAEWIPNNYTVTFDVNGGDEFSEDEGNNKTVTFNTTYDTLPIPTRTGYTFSRWIGEENKEITQGTIVNTANNHALYAEWTANKYIVSFNVNGGDELTENKKNNTVTFNSSYGTLPTPKRRGYTFSVWITEENRKVTHDTVVSIAGNHALYAEWIPNNYTVLFNVNGGDRLAEDEKNTTVTFNSSYGTLPTPTKRGYKFVRWFNNENIEVTRDTVVSLVDNHALCAEWIPNNYTVIFDVNGGDELIEEERNKTVTFNTTYDTLPISTRTGYTFSDWFTADGELITNGCTVNITNDCTFYANWTANIYDIEFDPCGGDGLDGMQVTFDSRYDCLPTPFRDGYAFLWWYIKGTNEIIYNTTVVGTACNHTLCAAWDKNTIIFDVNGGDELDDKKMEVTYERTYKDLPTPTWTGYTFDGWYTDDGVKITGEPTIKILTDQTLHARWLPNSYTIPLNSNGGKLDDNKKNITVTYNSTYGEIPTPTRTGYTFIGWVTEKGETITINTIVTDPCGCTLSAGWAVNTYIIMFVTNGGDELGENEVRMEVTYDGIYGLLPTPTRKGYEFVGWFNEDDKEIKTGTKVDVAGNQTITAEWTPNEYVVTFNPKGCDETINREEKEEVFEIEMEEVVEIEVTYDAPYDSLPTPERTGYEFDGWFTEDGKLITGETRVGIAGDHRLCPEWVPSEYTVTFDVNGGNELTDDEKEMKVTYGGTYENFPTPTWKGHKFAGWFNDDGNGEKVTAGTVVDITKDQALYAHWDETLSSQINIVIGKKDLSEDEIRKILEIFTEAEFTIESIEHNDAGETIAIIKFNDYTKAEEFIKNLMESSDEMKKFIRITYSSSKVDVSVSSVFYPVMALSLFLI